MAKNLLLGIVFLSAFFCSANLWSQLPTAPINLNTVINYDGSNYVLLLTWQNDSDFALTDKFNIYLATGNTEDTGDFSLSSTITRDGDEMTVYSYSHTFTVVDNYSVYVTGQNIIGEGPASEYMHFLAGPTITFTTTPGETELNGIVSALYSYDVDAVASDAGSVTFSLMEPSVPGMSIEASSGTLTWTPANIGLYNVTVIARHVDYPIVQETQNWEILVRSCEQLTYLNGYVNNQNDEPVSGANITVKSLFPIDTTVYYYATTDETGYFSIEVLEGAYVVYVSGDNLISEWYANQDFEFDANIVEIACGQTQNIEIDVETYELHTVSGYISEESTGYPVYPGTVEVIELYLNKINNIYTVSTANDGFYSIELNNRYHYKIIAYDDYNPKKFIPMYYNNSYDYLESEYLVIENEDIENLNFVLKEYPVSLNAINGKVRDNMGTGVKAMLILYKHQETSGVRTIESDDNGNFTFRNLESGKYIVRAIPYGNYTSGFYHITEEVVPHWFDATLINVDENTEFINHLMVVRATTYPDGEYNIYGGVFINNNVIDLKNEKTQADESIQGAVVYLLNSKNAIVSIQTTNQHGGFSFRDIASDHYTIKVDKIGYQYYTSDDVYVNEIDRTKVVAIYLDRHSHTNPTISFKSTPTTKANVGQLYSYDAEAITNSIDTVLFELAEAPVGMIVGKSSGLINWTPESSGTFSVTLEAYLKNNPAVNIQQSWKIDVLEGSGTAYLSVLVKQGSVIYPDATLNLYPTDFSSTFTLSTDAEAKALFAVPGGDYYLHLMGELFQDCWYNNKTDFADAEKLSLTAGDTLDITAMVTDKIIKYKISGVVTNDNSATIEDASVHFILETGEIRTVFTDADGNFSFEIGKDTAFRAFAVKDGQYSAQFYPSLYDFAEAPLMKNINKNDFDFELEQLPKSTVNIEGAILDESALPIPAVVVAYKIEEAEGSDALKYSVDYVNSTVATDGNYNLVVPISSNYIVRAYPADLNYYPAYYSEEAEPVYSWRKTNIIEASGGLIEDIYIKTEKVTPTSGAGKISGTVEMIIFNMMSVSYTQMLPLGVTVFASDQAGKICKYTYTYDSQNGYYSLSNLGLNQWKIAAEKVGLADINAERTITLTQSEPSYVDIMLYYSFGSSVDEDAEKIISLYPNPVGSIINISFKQANIFNSTITILDNLGYERMSFDSNAENVSFEVSSLTSGAYYIRITSGMKTYTMPFIKVR
ncbi:MAG: carboxypeptidase regulatory-like domain-containing protein [bacterium]